MTEKGLYKELKLFHSFLKVLMVHIMEFSKTQSDNNIRSFPYKDFLGNGGIN